jgi:hypothetical protein
MNRGRGILATISSACAAIVLFGCYRPDIAVSPDIALNDYSKMNYTAVESRLQTKVCIRGRLSIDSMGVYYPLQPTEEEGVINLGFSRIKTDLDRNAALRSGLTNGGTETLCGLLVEATPFKGCADVECKWYALTGATLPR